MSTLFSHLRLWILFVIVSALSGGAAFAGPSSGVDDEEGRLVLSELEELDPDPALVADAPMRLSHAVEIRSVENPIFESPANSSLRELIRARTRSARQRRPARVLRCGSFTGIASWYTASRQALTASGQNFDPDASRAAHLTLPFRTRVRVTNLRTNQSTVVTINDNGPHIPGRIIDLTRSAAVATGVINNGVARVRIDVICEGRASDQSPEMRNAPEPARSSRSSS